MRLIAFAILFLHTALSAQKVDSIFFNLYTDSLKKAVHNYINVDGKMPDGTYRPLMADEIVFSSSAGRWEGNSIIIDSQMVVDSVIITATLRNFPALTKQVVIYLKRIIVEPALKTEEELLEEWKTKSRSKIKQ